MRPSEEILERRPSFRVETRPPSKSVSKVVTWEGPSSGGQVLTSKLSLRMRGFPPKLDFGPGHPGAFLQQPEPAKSHVLKTRISCALTRRLGKETVWGMRPKERIVWGWSPYAFISSNSRSMPCSGLLGHHKRARVKDPRARLCTEAAPRTFGSVKDSIDS